MIGLDTNVLVRYFAHDDEAQAREADRVVNGLDDEAPGFVSLITLYELIWVLDRAYKVPHNEVLTIVDRMLRARELRIQESDAVHRAVRTSRATSTGVVDALITELGDAAGCTETVTFDQGAAKDGAMRLLTPHGG